MVEQKSLYKCPNHTGNLNEMRLKDKWCDVTIKVNQKEFRAHKVILGANLKYFEIMLSNSFQESKEGIINMESVGEADLEAFISYAYTGEMLLTESNALNLLMVANYLSEDGIKDACIDFLNTHLKQEEACRAYRFANNIDCLSLKEAAKVSILSNIGICSQTTDYLDLDFQCLADIMLDGKTQSIELQQSLFEGIVRWIMHDVKNRKNCTDGLLGFINIAKLSSDDLIGYLYRNIADRDPEYGSIRDSVIYSYHTSKIQQIKHIFMIVGDIGRKVDFQICYFTEKIWSPLQNIPDDHRILSNGAVLNNKLYYISQNLGTSYLRAFDFTTKRSTTICSSCNILPWAAVCADGRFLYLCGGLEENSPPSDQIIKLDPHTISMKKLAPMATQRWGATAIIYEKCLHVLGGVDKLMGEDRELNTVCKYDSIKNGWITLHSMCEPRRSFGVAILDGKLYACGGFSYTLKTTSVEVYDPSVNRWHLLASMKKARSTFVVIAHEEKLLAVGGDAENTVEWYDPKKDQWQVDHELSSGLRLQHTRGGLIQIT